MSGFIPNSVQFPNVYFDEFLDLLTAEEFKVLAYLVRRIFGFQKRQDRVAVSQICSGLVSRVDGRRLDGGTGLDENTVRRALGFLVDIGLVIRGDRNNAGTLYSLQLDSAQVDLAKLQVRREARRRSYAGRMPAPVVSDAPPSLFDLGPLSGGSLPGGSLPGGEGGPAQGGPGGPSQQGTINRETQPETKEIITPASPSVARRTDAVKRGDLLDGMLQHSAAARPGQLDLADFSEEVRPVLQRMFELWGVVPPPKAGRGSPGSVWEKEARWVNQALGSFGLGLLDDVKAADAAFIPARPQSLVSWISRAAAARRGPQQPAAPGWSYDAQGRKIRPGALPGNQV